MLIYQDLLDFCIMKEHIFGSKNLRYISLTMQTFSHEKYSFQFVFSTFY